MTGNAPEQEKMPHILFVGKTAIDWMPIGRTWRAFFSGNAAHAALAANYGVPEDHPERGYKPVRISVVTTLGRNPNDVPQNKLLDQFANAGIEVFSHEDAQAFNHVYLPVESSLREERISQRYEPSNFTFEPLNIPGVKELTPDVVVIGGSLVTDPRTSSYMLDLAQHFHGKGSLIEVDLWDIPNDVSTTEKILSLAHVIKMSHSLLLSNWADSDDPKNDIKAAKKIVGSGNNIAVITDDKRVEATTYWNNYRGEIRRNCAPPYGVFRYSVTANEILTGTLARALAESGATPESLKTGLHLPDKIPDPDNTAADPKKHNSGFVARITERMVEVQGRAIEALDKHPLDRDPLIEVKSVFKMRRLINGKRLTP